MTPEELPPGSMLPPTNAGPYQWMPGAPPPPPSPQPGPSASTQRRGLFGILTAIGAAALKYGFLVLKLFKFSTLFSVLISYGFMVLFYGWQFGAGVVILILIHEFGHMLAATREGIPVSAPMFMGPFGAFVRTAPRTDSRQDAAISVAGPMAGAAAALGCLVLAAASHTAYWQSLFEALGSFGFFITLFNLVPVGPFDGAKVARAISPSANLAASVTLIGVFAISDNIVILLLALVSGYVTFHRFRHREPRHTPGLWLTPATPRAQFAIALTYCVLIAVCGVGMTWARDAAASTGISPFH